MKNILFYIATLILIGTSCSADEQIETNGCDYVLIIDEQLFNNARTGGISARDISIDGNCLIMTIGFSGCSVDQEIQLVTNGFQREPIPPEIDVVLHHPSEVTCQAVFMREISYDLTPLLANRDPSGQLKIFVIGTEEQILWDY